MIEDLNDGAVFRETALRKGMELTSRFIYCQKLTRYQWQGRPRIGGGLRRWWFGGAIELGVILPVDYAGRDAGPCVEPSDRCR